MTTPALRGTRIAHARIRAPRADAESCAARCAAIVPGLDLEPATMPPQAILCVRSLPDPLPGGIDARSRHAQSRPVEWEAAMRALLRDTLHRAVRPIYGPVPPTAEAVLFADPSELLACAARDVCGGLLGHHWWWRHLVPPGGFAAVIQTWRDAPTYVPAAFESLMATTTALPFVRRLRATDAALLLDAVLRAHGASWLAGELTALWSRGHSGATIHMVAAPANSGLSPQERSRPRHQDPHAAPWRGIVPVEWERADLSVEQHTFASLCIVLRRAPALPQRHTFATALIAHLREHEASPAPRTPQRAIPAPTTPQVSEPPGFTPAAEDADASPAEHRAPASPHESPWAAPSHAQPPLSTRARPELPVSDPVVRRPGHAPAPPSLRVDPVTTAVPSADAIDGTPAPHANRPEPAAPDAASSLPLPDIEAGVESEYAGAFFLLNVARDLQLYGDGWDAGNDLALGVWDFIELVARDILDDDEIDGDSLVGILHALVDPAVSLATPMPADERAALLARVHQYAALALEVEDATSTLVRRRGRVVRSAAHVDVHFSLERHPLEIRMARLDRNPGWIPAAGVHVGFHFN